MEMITKLLKSRTVWLALIQAIVGVAIAVFTELDMGGALLVVKSLADIVLRLDTSSPISAK